MSDRMPDQTEPPVPETESSRKKGFAFAYLAFILSALTGLFLLGTMMVTHLGFISFELGFRTLTLDAGPRLALVSLAIAAISLLVSLFVSPKRNALWAMAAVVISGGILFGYNMYDRALKAYPPIADVATNWDRPLSFSEKLVTTRGPGALPIEDKPVVKSDMASEWNGKSLATVNQATCPAAKTLNRTLADTQIADVAAALKKKHFRVFGTAPWRIEATHQDNFYGFRSDIVIRIDPISVDVRSVSRYPHPDLGENCRLVTDVLDIIKNIAEVTP
ncbi:MAG: DUF1499 domain-containing protein [Asticcacaulis sp.]